MSGILVNACQQNAQINPVWTLGECFAQEADGLVMQTVAGVLPCHRARRQLDPVAGGISVPLVEFAQASQVVRIVEGLFLRPFQVPDRVQWPLLAFVGPTQSVMGEPIIRRNSQHPPQDFRGFVPFLCCDQRLAQCAISCDVFGESVQDVTAVEDDLIVSAIFQQRVQFL